MTLNLTSDQALWLPFTLALYFAASELHRRAGKSALLNPTMLTIAGVCVALHAGDVSHARYFETVEILHYLLGTAVVALAIPLYGNLQRLDGNLRAMCAALLCGSMTSIVVGLIVAQALGASLSTMLSLAAKSATVAVSIEIARLIGGIPPVTACLTICTGITGAVIGPYLLSACGVRTSMARGLALGTAGHGIATARAFAENEETGCWASLAMGLNAILTAMFAPLIVAAYFSPK